MSKAEEKALKKYPAERGHMHDRPYQREGFIEGYHQAEKDLELTWKDIKIILDVENDILHECNNQKELIIETYPKEEYYYGEILKRYRI